jgi:hypothetical protein
MEKKHKQIGKEQVALIQLQDALKLYYDEHYISAITLAGAAEEIFKKLSDHAMSQLLGGEVKHNHVDMSMSFLAMTFANAVPGYDLMNEDEKEEVHDYLTKELHKEYNETKNALKHKGKGENNVRYNSFKQEAEKYLSGAIISLCMYKKKMPNEFPLITRYCKERGINYH